MRHSAEHTSCRPWLGVSIITVYLFVTFVTFAFITFAGHFDCYNHIPIIITAVKLGVELVGIGDSHKNI